MNTLGFILLSISVLVVSALTTYCYYKVLTSDDQTMDEDND